MPITSKLLTIITIVLFSIVLVSGCGDNDVHKKTTSSIIIDKDEHLDTKPIVKHIDKNISSTKKVLPILQDKNITILRNFDNKVHQMAIDKGMIDLDDTDHDILLFELFLPTDIVSLGKMPYIDDIQKKYQDDMIVIAISEDDNKESIDSLKVVIKDENLSYFISIDKKHLTVIETIKENLTLETNTTSLSILYVKGKYFTHYEGRVPIEMIEYDILQAKKLLKDKRSQ